MTAKEKRRRIFVYFTPELYSKLEEICKKRGTRKSPTIQYILSKALEEGNV